MRTFARIGNIFHPSPDLKASRLVAIRTIVGLANDAEIYAATSLRVLGASEAELMVAMLDDPMGDQ